MPRSDHPVPAPPSSREPPLRPGRSARPPEVRREQATPRAVCAGVHLCHRDACAVGVHEPAGGHRQDALSGGVPARPRPTASGADRFRPARHRIPRRPVRPTSIHPVGKSIAPAPAPGEACCRADGLRTAQSSAPHVGTSPLHRGGPKDAPYAHRGGHRARRGPRPDPPDGHGGATGRRRQRRPGRRPGQTRRRRRSLSPTPAVRAAPGTTGSPSPRPSPSSPGREADAPALDLVEKSLKDAGADRVVRAERAPAAGS